MDAQRTLHQVNRLAQQLFGAAPAGTWSRPTGMPVDAFRHGDEFVIAFDLPGVDADAIDIDVERSVLTVRAERRPIDRGEQATAQLTERPLLRVPIVRKAKPRKISVSGRSQNDRKVIAG